MIIINASVQKMQYFHIYDFGNMLNIFHFYIRQCIFSLQLELYSAPCQHVFLRDLVNMLKYLIKDASEINPNVLVPQIVSKS